MQPNGFLACVLIISAMPSKPVNAIEGKIVDLQSVVY